MKTPIEEYNEKLKKGEVTRKKRGPDKGPRKPKDRESFAMKVERATNIKIQDLAADQFEMTQWMMKKAMEEQDFDKVSEAAKAYDRLNRTLLPYVAPKMPQETKQTKEVTLTLEQVLLQEAKEVMHEVIDHDEVHNEE